AIRFLHQPTKTTSLWAKSSITPNPMPMSKVLRFGNLKMNTLSLRALILSLTFLFVVLGIWEISSQAPEKTEARSEYEMLMGGADQEARVPPPSAIVVRAWEELSNPFYDAGPNDKGIGIQLGYSIYRVLTGFFLAVLIAI